MYAQNANLATYTLTMALYNIVFKFETEISISDTYKFK